MANPVPQPVIVVANLAAFNSSPVSGYAPGGAQIAYLQGEVTELDGGQGFYQARDNDYVTAASFPSIIVDSTGLRWQVTTAVTMAQIVSALTNAGTTPGLDPLSGTASIAAAATTDLSTVAGNYVDITGAGATIASLGTLTAGRYRFCTFAGINTLDHDNTALILPGGANITTAAGDFALFVSLGSGNWKCLVYQEAAGGTPGTLPVAQGGTGLTSGTSGGILGFTAATTLASSVALTANAIVLGGGAGATPAPLGSLGTATTVLHGNAAGAPTFAAVSLTADVSGVLPVANGGTNAATTVAGYDSLGTQGSDIAAAPTVDLGTATGPYVNVTGSAATITALGTAAAGVHREVKFEGANTLTHNGTSLILPGAANITTAANDTALFISLGSGNWLCARYTVQAAAAYSSGTWTPALTFATPGDLAVTYTTQVGTWVRIGNMVFAQMTVTTATFTHTTASGDFQITGLPFTSKNVSGQTNLGAGSWRGVTKANYTDMNLLLSSNTNIFVIRASGSGQTPAALAAADLPTGTVKSFVYSIAFEV